MTSLNTCLRSKSYLQAGGANGAVTFVENMPPLIARKTPWFENEDLKAKGVNLRD